MSLKCMIDRLEDVAEPLRSLYSPGADGRFVLALEGEPPGYVKAQRLAEFRENNRALNAQVQDLQAQLRAGDDGGGTDDDAEFEALEAKLRTFDGIDPEEYRALKARPDDSARVAELEAALAREQAAHTGTQFTHAVSTEFLRLGGRSSAVEFMVAQAAKVFALKDGALTSSAFSAANPGEQLSLSEWMDAQRRESGFAFQPSRGGGAPVGGSSAPTAKRTVSAADPLEFGRNLAAIAAGDVSVI